LENVCDAVPTYDMKTKRGDFKDKFGKESCLYPACGWHSLHNGTNDNGDLARQEPGINVRTFTRSPGNHLITKYVTR
jgi:hypothetical protein